MQPAQRKQLQELLLARRVALTAEGDLEVLAEVQEQVVEKPDEDAAPLTEMNQVIASNRNRERAQRLQEIDAALVRMQEDPDGFGHCEECDEAIAMRRLEVMPWTRLCTDCQAAQEEARLQRGGRRHLRDFR